MPIRAIHLRFLLPLAAISGVGACNIDNLLNQTASFGGVAAGQRANFTFVLINNTPFRAILTAGAYDDLDQKTQPVIHQFGNDPQDPSLEANSRSGILVASCHKVFGIGTQQLIQFVEENLEETAFDEGALVPGVFFSSGELGTEEGGTATEGVAPPFEALLGADFPCNAFLVVRLEFDDDGPDGFRIDMEVIPAEDDRNPPGAPAKNVSRG